MTQVQILMYHRVGHFPGRVKAHGASTAICRVSAPR